MAELWQRLMLVLLRRFFPVIYELYVPVEWTFNQSMIIFLEKPQAGMVGELVRQLWALPWFAAARLLVFTDSPVGMSELSHLLWRSINVVENSRDVYRDQTGERIAIDATAADSAGKPVQEDAYCTEKVAQRWKEYGFA